MKLNFQRRTSLPLFAAIGNANTDAKLKQCMVEAFESVDLSMLFEHITTHKNNLISLIHQLGRNVDCLTVSNMSLGEQL